MSDELIGHSLRDQGPAGGISHPGINLKYLTTSKTEYSPTRTLV